MEHAKNVTLRIEVDGVIRQFDFLRQEDRKSVLLLLREIGEALNLPRHVGTSDDPYWMENPAKNRKSGRYEEDDVILLKRVPPPNQNWPEYWEKVS